MENLSIRQKEMIAVTRDILLNEDFSNINMKYLSEKMNLTRSLLYRQFNNTNEILLFIFLQEFEIIIEKLKINKQVGEEFLNYYIDLQVDSNIFPKIVPILTVVIEEKTSIDILTDFKKRLMDQKLIIDKIVSERLNINLDNADDLTLKIIIAINGSYAFVINSEKQIMAYKNIGIDITKRVGYQNELVKNMIKPYFNEMKQEGTL